MSKFKAGDKVRCISSSDGDYFLQPVIEKIYTVINDTGFSDRIIMEDSDGQKIAFNPNDFELVEDKKTGGSRYNSGKLRWRNVPMFLLRPVVEVGAAAEKIEGNPTGKYPTYNFLQGLSVADCMDCLKRHLDAVDDPNQPDIDPEDGRHHLAKVAWNALVALHYINTRPDLDDRYKGETND